MSKQKLAIVIILFLVVVVFIFVKSTANKNRSLTNPGLFTPLPSASSYNPPKEIKYDSSTDLKKELDSINPQVLDSDFE
ncbi:hypothetical protein HYT74_03425 [Candidatus Daviesbacteria bacterium]|nr:hypothetical protein [Candidatus Daviesbacteria bacterium]